MTTYPKHTKWTLALSWGSPGGVYVCNGYCKRICLRRLAITLVPDTEIDEMMEAYVERAEREGYAKYTRAHRLDHQ